MEAQRSAGEILAELVAVRELAVDSELRRADELDDLADDHRPSGRNLVHYLALRSVDLRAAQRDLAERGLSSLGRAEAHILATLDAVIERLAGDVGRDDPTAHPALPDDLGRRGPSARSGRSALERHARQALGAAPAGRSTRVMVTLPSEAATDPGLVDTFVAAGMSVARINGAHDDPEAWRSMAAHVHAAARRRGVAVRIAFDLAGPKLRTGPIAPGPPVIRLKPTRDAYGHVAFPARWYFSGRDDAPTAIDGVTVVPVDPALVDGAEAGDRFGYRDARGKQRWAEVVSVDEGMVEVVSDRTSYLVAATPVVRVRGGERLGRGVVAGLPATPGVIHVAAGDPLLLVRGTAPGRDAVRNANGSVVEPGRVGVDVAELFERSRHGERVLLDDGSIETVVERADPDVLELRVVRPERGKLRAEKGINLPDAELPIPALSDDDIAALGAAVEFADLVAMSYVGGPDDVDRLHAELDRLGAAHTGVVLKIEHRRGFERLPDMLLRALRRPPAAVMVARGDLAVELGYERLAEVQEEILWLCEAAHVPVIWATQVLESLAKTGAPTRAEVTDAAWSSRAECVMLNKGPYIPETIRFLDDVLARMSEHQSKRTPMLRRLSVASAGS